jgi:hypothetical protein
VGRLGAGNMGVVFRVHHSELDASYALKVLRTDLGTSNDLARFQREIELVAAASKHPNVVGIHTASQEQGRIYYVMDLVEGEDLQARVSRGPLPARQAARYARDLASALAYLHAQGIVHRDIKPANVLIDDQDQPRLSDFGLARAFTDDQNRLTRTGEMIGTPYYMAPEQTFGRQVGPPADVYALGMLLYTLLAGRPAVSGASTLEVVEQIRQGRHVPLAEAAPQVPAALAEICARALAMTPDERPTAHALAETLETFLGGGAAGPSAGEAARKRTALIGAALILVVALLVSGALMLGSGEPGAPADAGARLQLASAELAQAVEALRAGDLAGSATHVDAGLEAMEDLDAEPIPNSAPPLQAKLLTQKGLLALLRDDADAARQAYDAALALIEAHRGPELRELKRVGTAGLRAGLELADPGDDEYDVEDALRDLARAREAAPDVEYLRRWRVRAAVAAGRAEEAVDDLAASADPSAIPAADRCAVWLAAGDLERALALLDETDDPALSAQVHYALALPALQEEHVARALEHLRPAMAAAPQDARREEALRLARSIARRAAGWSRGGDPAVTANALRREVEAATLVHTLDPDYELPRERLDTIYAALSDVGAILRQDTIDVVHDLITVVPSDVALYKLFAALVMDWGFPDPTRDIALIRRGLGLAQDPADQRQLIEHLSAALYTQQLLPELTQLAESIRGEDRPAELKAFVTGRVGDLLRYTGQLEESAVWLARTRELDPDGFDLAVFEYAFHRFRYERDNQPADMQAALAKAWVFLQVYRPGQWDDWFVSTCTWVCQREEEQGHIPRAIRALEIMVHFQPDQLRWETRRLGLLCVVDPYPAERIQAELAKLPGAIERVANELGSASDDETDPMEQDRLRDRAVALLQLSTRHLIEWADTDQRARLLQGLQQLETRLAEIQAR